MAQHTRGDESLAFVGMRGKTYEHQAKAMAAGYSSTAEWAIDLLAADLLELRNRVDALDGGAEVVVQEEDPEC